MVPEVRSIDRKKRTLIVASGGAVLVIGAAGVFTLMAVKDQTYVPSAPYEPQGELNSEIAVVYYSRSGHSEAVAREVARKFNAPITRIEPTTRATSRGSARQYRTRGRRPFHRSGLSPSISLGRAECSSYHPPGYSVRRPRSGLTWSRPPCQARRWCSS